MGDIFKTVPNGTTYVKFTQADIATGDVIRVLKSLGRTASLIKIECTTASDLSIRLNSLTTSTPRLHDDPWKESPGGLDEYYIDLSKATEIDSGSSSIPIGDTAGPVNFEWEGAIRDVEVTYTTGSFNIYLSY